MNSFEKWGDQGPAIVLDREIGVDTTKAAKSPEDLVVHIRGRVPEVLNVTAVEMATVVEVNVVTVTVIDTTNEIVGIQVPIQIPPVQTQTILVETKCAVFH